MNPISEEPILADKEASISSQNESTSSKKWKKSTFIFGSIMGLVVLIPIVFSIVNMVEDSSLKHETILNEIKKIKSFVNYTAGILLRNINDLITNLIRSVLVIFLYSRHIA